MSYTLRHRILAFVGALILLSLLGSTLSLYRISEVQRSLDAINRVSIPLGRLFAQMQSDAEVFAREAERRLGYSRWPQMQQDPHWRARPIPKWIEDVIENEVERAGELIRKDLSWTTAESRAKWQEWVENLASGFSQLRTEAARLHSAIEHHDHKVAAEIQTRFGAALEEWKRQLQWGANEYERSLRQTFSSAESRVAELRTGLQMILIVVVFLSFLLLWLGERALRPLGELTRIARQITRHGLRKEDKVLLPVLDVARNDEVSALAREFHHMATSLLEREKTVENQKANLMATNRLLREMGELNENVLNSMKSVLIATDLEGRVTQCNPVAIQWLSEPLERIMGSRLGSWEKARAVLGESQALVERTQRIEPQTIDGRVYGGSRVPLRDESGGARGTIFMIEDLTDEMDLQERLRRAENLAAVGRMSAQVAHEVRNPLHSIGLEAEMAVELASRVGHPALKQSLQSILGSVDRLEKITDNYLKLSRLSAGEKGAVDLAEVLDCVLATYAPACEAQGVKVDWGRQPGSSSRVWGDRELLEQALGNLMRNALQALQEARSANSAHQSQINWTLGSLESGRVWLRIEDSGFGVAPEARERLFTPFMTTKAQGTGLGLSFIKKVLEDHGGSITCQERAPGTGACFELLLPSAPPRHFSGVSQETLNVGV